MEAAKDKVLIIDDSLLNVRILTDMLGADYEVLFAQTGEKGLKIARAENPDIILLDIIMPEMDGYEVCSRIKKDPLTAEIPVIFVTSLDEKNDEEKGLESGAIDYIAKPFCAPVVRIRVKNQLELKKHRDFLKKLSTLDGLTGIPNRRQFDIFNLHEWQNAIRTQLPVSLIMMDIDYFKKYNDNYGHLAGDDCLKQVAQALVGARKRATDFVARYGGEEFACILPRTDLKGALLVAEIFRDRIDKLSISHAYSKIADHITISLGVSSFVPAVGDAPEQLICQADKALYLAKSNGRNQVGY